MRHDHDDDADDLLHRLVLAATIVFTLLLDVTFVAFIYKVWNERQMTHEYARQADAQERIARALETRPRSRQPLPRPSLLNQYRTPESCGGAR
jgi:hypothetical protein